MGCGSSFCRRKNDSVIEPTQSSLPSNEGSSRSLTKALSFRRLESSRSVSGLMGKPNHESKLSYGPDHHTRRKRKGMQESKYIRMMVSLPFKRNAVAAELYVRCIFPVLRDHCRKHGWNILVVDCVDEVDLDLGFARPDTLQLCRSELAKCLNVSAGPALLCMLDNSYELIDPLPPPLVPATEFEALLNFFRKWQKPDTVAMADEELGQMEVEDIGHVALLTRWYRQTRRYGPGGNAGEYAMCVPVDLSEDSIFRETGRRLNFQQRRERQGKELAALAKLLSAAAAAGLLKKGRDGKGDAVRFGEVMARSTDEGGKGGSAGDGAGQQAVQGGERRPEGAVEVAGRGGEEVEDDPLQLADLDGGQRLQSYSSSRAVAGTGGMAAEGAGEKGEGPGGAVEGGGGGHGGLEAEEGSRGAGRRSSLRSGRGEATARKGGVRFGEGEGEGKPAQRAGGLLKSGLRSTRREGERTGSDGAGMVYAEKTEGVLHKFEGGFYEQAVSQVAAAQGQAAFVLPPEGIPGPPEPIDGSFLDDKLPKELVDPPGKWKMSTFSHASALKEAKGGGGAGAKGLGRMASMKGMMRLSSFKKKDEEDAAPQKPPPGKSGQQRLPRDVRKKLRAMRAKGEDDGDGGAGADAESKAGDENKSADGKSVEAKSVDGGGEVSMLASSKASVLRASEGGTSVGGSMEASMLDQSGEGHAGMSQMSGFSGVSAVSAVSDTSASGNVFGAAAPFAIRGRGLEVGVEWAEVKGLPKNAAVYLDVYVVSSSGQEAPNMQTSKKKHDADGIWAWRKLTPVAVEGRVLDEGILHIRVMEKATMRSDKWLGTYSVSLGEVCVFEDAVQEKVGRQKWIVLSGKAAPTDLPSTFEVPDIPMIRVRLTVRAADSGRALLREAIRLGNNGEVERGLEVVEQAKRQLLRALNQPLAARAVKVEEELELRLRLVNDKTLRRLHWLQKKLGPVAEDVGQAEESEGRVLVQNGAPGGSEEEVWEALQVVRDHAVKGGWARGKSRADEDDLLLHKLPPFVKAGLARLIAGLKGSLDPFLAAPVPFVDPLKREMAAHHARREELTQGFVGQNAIIELVTKYCFDGNSHASPVFVLEGQMHGVGLSSVMAAVSTGVEKILGERSIGALFVTRFVGATPRSEDANTLLHAMILQLECQLALDATEGEAAWQHPQGKSPWEALREKSSEWFLHQRRSQQPPAGYAALCARMREIVAVASSRKPLIVLLDGMDELRGWQNSAEAGAGRPLMMPWEGFGEGQEGGGEEPAAVLRRLMAWLPFENPADPQLPPHVRVVLSYSSKSEATRAVLQPLAAKGQIAQLKGLKCEAGDDGAEPVLAAINAAAGAPLAAADLAMLDPANSEQAAKEREEKRKPAAVEPLALALGLRVKAAKLEFGKAGQGSSLLRRSHDEGALLHHRKSAELCRAFLLHLADMHGRPLLALCLRALLAADAGLAEDELLDLLTAVPPPPRRQKPAAAPEAPLLPPEEGEEGAPPPPEMKKQRSHSHGADGDGQAAAVLDGLRLLRDLQPLLRERFADGMQVLHLSHTAIRHSAYQFACEDATDLERAHGMLAAYFTGRESRRGWMGTEKPETPGAEEAKRWMRRLLHRPLFPAQPWYWTLRDDPLAKYFGGPEHSRQGASFSRSASFTSMRHRSGEGRRRILNLRKLRELVPQLVGAGMIEAAVEVVTDLHYCLLKAESGALAELAREYQLIRWHRTQSAHGFSRFLDGCGEFHRFVMQHRAELTLHPLMMFQLAANAHGSAPSKAAMRLLDKDLERPPWIRCLNPETPDTLHPRWTLEGHKEQVTCMAMTIDGSILVSVSTTNTPRIWQTANGKMVQELPPHSSRVVCIAISANDAHYALGDVDGTIKMWPLPKLDIPSSTTLKHSQQTDKKLHADFGVQAHNGPVRGVAFLPVKGVLVSCGADSAVKVWSTTKGSVLQMLKGHTAAVNGVMISAPPRPGGVASVLKGSMTETVGYTWSMDGTFKEWLLEKGKCTRTFAGHSAPVVALDTLTALDVIASASEDFLCRLWRRSDAARLAVIRHRAPLSYVRLDAEAEAVSTVDREGRLRTWDVRTYVNIGSCDALGMQAASPGWQAEVLPCTGSHEAGVLVMGCRDGATKAYSFRSVSFLAHAPLQPLSGRRESGVVAMSSTAATLATCGEGGQVAAWEVKSGDCKTKFNTTQGRVSCLALEPTTGWLLATGSAQGNILFWDIRAEEAGPIAGLGAHYHAVESVSFSSEGSLFASASADGTLRVWQTTLPHQHGLRKSSLNSSYALSPVRSNNHSMLSPSSPALPGLPLSSPHLLNHSLYTSINSSNVGAPPAAIFSLRPLHTLAGHKEVVRAAAFSTPHPARLASASLDSTIIVWDMSTGAKERVLRPSGLSVVPTCLSWCPGSDYIVSGGDDSMARIWSAETGREKVVLKGRRRADPLENLTIESLINGSLWNSRQAAVEEAKTKLGHKAEITAVAYTPSGEHVASASLDGSVKLWDAHTGNLVRTVLTIPQRTTVLCLAIDPEGQSLFAGLPEAEKKDFKLPPLKEKKLRKKLPEIKPEVITQKQSIWEDDEKKRKKKKKDKEGGNQSGEETSRTDADADDGARETKIGKNGKKLRKKRKDSDGTVQGPDGLVDEGGAEGSGEGQSVAATVAEPDPEVEVEVEHERVLGSGIKVKCACHSAEGNVSVTVSDNQRHLNLRDDKLQVTRNLEGHVDLVTDLAMSHNGIWLASGSLDGMIKVWETRTAICKWSQHCFRAGLSAVGMDAELELAVGGSTLGDVQVIDLAAASVVAQYEASTFRVIKTQLAEQGKIIVSGYEDGKVVLRDLRDNKNSVTIDPKKVDRDKITHGAAKKGFLGSLGFGGGKAEGVRMDCMAASDDVNVVVRGMGRAVEVWDIRMQKKLSVDRSHTGDVTALQLMDRGRLLVSGGQDCMLRFHLLSDNYLNKDEDTFVDHNASHDGAVTNRTLSTTLTRTPSMVGRAEGERRRRAHWNFGEEPELVGRVASKLCYYSSGGVSCIGGFESSSMLVGDEGGRLHHLSLQPGKDPP